MGARKVLRSDEGRRSTRCPPQGASGGFTFIEITIALVILAGSFVVLLSLQSAAIDREVQDYHRQLAMLSGRRIMAAIETFPGALPEGQKATTVLDMLSYVLDNVPPTDPQVAQNLKDFEARIQIDNWTIPGFDKKSMQRIELSIAWSESPIDRLTLLYFKPLEDTNDVA